MRKKFRHKVVFWLLRPFFNIWARLYLNYTFDRFKDKNGPYLILGNHTQPLDPVILSFSFSKPIYFVASKMVYNLPFLSKMMDYLVAPIPIDKFRSDLKSTKMILKTLKEGSNVALYPEGNTTFSGAQMPIDEAIAKLVKHAGVDLCLFTIEGGYLTRPRWAKRVRKGFMHGSVKKVISKETLKKMTLEEIFLEIKQTLLVNDYEAVQEVAFKGKEKALYLENSYYVCPSCKSLSSLISNKDELSCKVCDFNVLYTEQGTFKPKGYVGPYFETTIPWFNEQINYLKSHFEALSNDVVIFEDNKEHVYLIRDLKPKQFMSKGVLKLSKKALIFEGENHNEIFPIGRLKTAVQQKSGLIIYNPDTQKTHYFLSHPRRSALKYVQAIKVLQKEMKYV